MCLFGEALAFSVRVGVQKGATLRLCKSNKCFMQKAKVRQGTYHNLVSPAGVVLRITAPLCQI